MLLEPDSYVGADAVMIAVCVRSLNVSFTPVIVNVVESEPAGIVTEAGTVASVVSLLTKFTTKSFNGSGNPFLDTVPIAVPPFSLMEAWAISTVNVGISRFQTVELFTPKNGVPAV